MKIKLLYITILSILLIPACKQDPSSYCPSYSTNYQTLSASTINQTPYFTNKAFDTISFASDKGDTVIFVKAKTDTAWYCENDNSNADCPKENANCYQILHNNYSTVRGTGNFDVKLFNKNSIIQFTFLGNIISLYNDVIGVKTPKGYKENAYFNNISFKKVTLLEGVGNDNGCSVYINNSYGLFRVEFQTTNVNWTYYAK